MSMSSSHPVIYSYTNFLYSCQSCGCPDCHGEVCNCFRGWLFTLNWFNYCLISIYFLLLLHCSTWHISQEKKEVSKKECKEASRKDMSHLKKFGPSLEYVWSSLALHLIFKYTFLWCSNSYNVQSLHTVTNELFLQISETRTNAKT